MTTNKQNTAEDQSAFTASYDKCISAIRAVPESELIPINLNINTAVTTVLGSLPEIEALEPEIAKLPGVNQGLVKGLADYARAAGEANSRYVIAVGPQSDLSGLYADALHWREVLRSDADALSTRGLIDASRLAAFKGLPGFKNVAFELIDRANLMHEVWSNIKGKTALTEAEIAQAKDVGEKLVVATGVHDQSPAAVQDVAHVRQQAFTLMMHSYDEVRRAVAFLRWKQGDADTIAPSLYQGHGGHKASAASDNAAASPSPAAQPASPAPADGASNGAAQAAPGMPGGSPLAS